MSRVVVTQILNLPPGHPYQTPLFLVLFAINVLIQLDGVMRPRLGCRRLDNGTVFCISAGVFASQTKVEDGSADQGHL